MEPDLTPEQRQAFAEALYAGRKIEAIKQLRELSGLGLKESKEVIERIEADLRAAHPERFAKASKGFGCAVVVALLTAGVAGMAILLWVLF